MEESKNLVILDEHHVRNTSDPNYPGTFTKEEQEEEEGIEKEKRKKKKREKEDDAVWSLERFKKKFQVRIVKFDPKENEMEFDLIGIDCAIANAIRRILLSEVPSMAIEKVFVYNNTSLIKDEVLSHRLGLVPLKANPRLFEYKTDSSAEASEQDTLEYELKVKCTVNNEGHRNSHLNTDLYKNDKVYSNQIKWVPIKRQAEILSEKDVKPVFDDILLNKLRPGQELDLKLQAVKGIGKDHAKFSPVATAHYRMLPQIKLLEEVTGEAAERLQSCFSPGVIEVKTDQRGKKKAVVANARYDTCSRIVFRHDDLKDKVQIGRIRDHFIFNIESVGALPPDELFLEAVDILGKKCRQYIDELDHISEIRK